MRNINLFTSFYTDSNFNRGSELQSCLIHNASNNNISKVILLNNPRPTYMDFFKETQKYPDDINIIANSDIYFDDTITLLKELCHPDTFEKWFQGKPYQTCLALTRWDIKESGIERFINRGSQDVWIFFGSVKKLDQLDASYTLGTPGCDNRIARELHDAGYKVYNPSETIRTIHLHTSNVRNYDERDTIFGEHLLIEATRLDNVKDTKYFKTTKTIPAGFQPKQKVEEKGQIINPYFLNQQRANIRVQEATKPKILHVALSAGDNGLTKAFKKVSEYREIDWSSSFKLYDKQFVNNQIIAEVEKFKPDLVFMQIQTDNMIDAETIKLISDKTFVIHWGGDKREELPNYYTSIAPYVHLTCSTCMEDVNKMRENGWKADFLQIGFDPEIYKPGLRLADSCPPIIFTGTNYGMQFPLSAYRQQMVDFLRVEFGEKFQAYGRGWPHNLPYLDQPTEARHFNTCKIAINLSHFNSMRYTSDRIFRIMGSGAFCLSHYYPGIEADFTIGTHLDTFRNLNELLTKINHYTQNDAERNRIAMNGKNLVHTKFTFDNMIQNILKLYNQYKNESTLLHTATLR